MVTVERHEVRAGETVRGLINDGAGSNVVLLRLEISPAGTVPRRLAEGQANGAGEFALELPEDSVPTAQGRKCAIEYVVRTAPDKRRDAVDLASVEVVGRLEAGKLEESMPFGDRMIARFEARRFHIELTEVDVQGGGTLAGRVHVFPGKKAEGVVVTCCCVESWRVNGRSVVHNRRQPPLWKTETIWSESVTPDWREGETWSGFRVPLPAELPVAMEGRSIAWRYEVEASLRTRLGMHDRAMTTPMGFEIRN
jgi:hypothetical protein